MQKMLNMDPTKRWEAVRLMGHSWFDGLEEKESDHQQNHSEFGYLKKKRKCSEIMENLHFDDKEEEDDEIEDSLVVFACRDLRDIAL